MSGGAQRPDGESIRTLLVGVPAVECVDGLGGTEIEVTAVDTVGAAREALGSKRVDCVVSGTTTGVDGVEALADVDPSVPVLAIVASGSGADRAIGSSKPSRKPQTSPKTLGHYSPSSVTRRLRVGPSTPLK